MANNDVRLELYIDRIELLYKLSDHISLMDIFLFWPENAEKEEMIDFICRPLVDEMTTDEIKRIFTTKGVRDEYCD